MKTADYTPNTVLPKGAKLLKKPRILETGTWIPQEVDAKVECSGITWYRVKGGLGGRGDREDWIADVPAVSISVHDYQWNGEDLVRNQGSFEEATEKEAKSSLEYAEYRLKEAQRKVKELEQGIALLKKHFAAQ